VSEVILLPRGVDDNVEPAIHARVGRAGDHQIVDDAAILVQQLRVTLLARFKRPDVGRNQRFHCACGGGEVRATEERLSHVGDVEQTGLAARVVVFGDDACGVLHRHFVAGERHHACAERNVGAVKRGVFQVGCG
jgi:hypothetical protein